MGYDLRRAATALLACLTVALAAMLLPAAGVGSYPGVVGEPAPGPGPGSGPDVGPDGPEGPTGPTQDPGDTTESPDSDPTTDEPGTSVTDGGDEPTTTTERSTTTTDDRSGAAGGDGDFGGLVSGLVSTFLAFVFLVAAGVAVLTVGLLFGGLFGGPIRLARRSADGDDTLLLRIFGIAVSLGGFRRLSRGSLRTVLGLARSTGTLLSGLGGAARGVLSALTAGGSLLAATGGAVGRLESGLVAALRGAGGALASLSFGLGSLAGGLANWRPGFGRGDSPADDARDAGAVPGPEASEDGASADPGPQSVEEAWQRFVDRVPLSRPEVRTPGEVARTAVREDWPAGPVRRLTRTFREVRYGDVPADEDRTESAVGAYDRLDDGGDQQ